VARPLRIEYPGAMYHVMCRGNNGRGISCKFKYPDDTDERGQSVDCGLMSQRSQSVNCEPSYSLHSAVSLKYACHAEERGQRGVSL